MIAKNGVIVMGKKRPKRDEEREGKQSRNGKALLRVVRSKVVNGKVMLSGHRCCSFMSQE